MSSTFFFSTLSCHKEDRNWAMVQTTGKVSSSDRSRLRVRIIVDGGFQLLEVLAYIWISEVLGRILETLSAVGRIWWSSLKRNVVRVGPSMCCLAISQVLFHWVGKLNT